MELGNRAMETGNTAVAEQCFDAALGVAPRSAAALYGSGAVAAAQGDDGAAIDLFNRAAAADPGMVRAWIALRTAELRRAEQILDARHAQDQGLAAAAAMNDGTGHETADEAAEPGEAAYREAIELAPRILPPYLRLAADLTKAGDVAAAVEVLERARSFLGDNPMLLEALSHTYLVAGDTANAVETAGRLVKIAPGHRGSHDLLEDARRRHERATLPASFRNLANQPRITRQELAGLLAIRLPADALAAQPGPSSRPPTDLDGAWAAEHIRRVTAAGIMEVFPNHTFAPDLVVSRGMLAETLYRALWWGGGGGAPSYEPRITDVPREHLSYEAIRSVVGRGLMSVDARGRFRILDVASGREVVDAVEGLRSLLR